jgi:predicted GIY-YIG superfamily endonuclease
MQSDYLKKYYLKNSIKIRSKQKERYINNRETILAKQRAYRLKNKETINSAERHKNYLIREKAIAAGLFENKKKPMKYWTRKRILKEALKFKTKTEWRNGSPGSHDAARKDRDFYKEATQHMVPIGNSHKRCLYSFTIAREKIVYIGITYNFKQRIASHLRSKRFQDLIKKYGRNALEIKQETEYLELNFAIKLERDIIKKLKKSDWNVLNILEGGGIGGITKKWTDKNILTSIKNHKLFKDWRLEYPGAYNTALRNKKLIEEIHSVLAKTKGGQVIIWTKEKILQEALKFKTRGEWFRKSASSYNAAKRLGIFVEASKHMILVRRKLTDSLIMEDALKYKLRGEWKNNSSSIYSAATRKKEIFKKATAHMKPKWK